MTPAPNAPRRGRLIVLAGPSGVGKSSVVAQLRSLLPQLFFSVSATTRDRRPGEVDGHDYRFVTPAEFDSLVTAGALLEWAEVHGGLQRSGTPRGPVEDTLHAGAPVLVEVDLQGARAIKAALPEAVTVFLEPPSFDELARRLRARGTESPAQFARRLDTARVELAARDEFDIAVVNAELTTVVARLVELLVGPADPVGPVPPSAPRASTQRASTQRASTQRASTQRASTQRASTQRAPTPRASAPQELSQ